MGMIARRLYHCCSPPAVQTRLRPHCLAVFVLAGDSRCGSGQNLLASGWRTQAHHSINQQRIKAMSALTAELAFQHDALLGEGPVWDWRTQRLYWVDIEGYKVHCYDPATRAQRAIDVGEYVGSAAIRAAGGLVLALKSGFASLDLETEKLTHIADA